MTFISEREKEMCERAQTKLDVPPWARAGGDVICKGCGFKYFDHPAAVPWTWLRVLCDGRYVKL